MIREKIIQKEKETETELKDMKIIGFCVLKVLCSIYIYNQQNDNTLASIQDVYSMMGISQEKKRVMDIFYIMLACQFILKYFQTDTLIMRKLEEE